VSILWARDRACEERISIDFDARSLEEQVREYDNVVRFRRQADALFKQISRYCKLPANHRIWSKVGFLKVSGHLPRLLHG
jgi:hypothetical protein